MTDVWRYTNPNQNVMDIILNLRPVLQKTRISGINIGDSCNERHYFNLFQINFFNHILRYNDLLGRLEPDSLRVLSYFSPYYCVIHSDDATRREFQRLCDFTRMRIAEKFNEYRSLYETIPLMSYIINLLTQTRVLIHNRMQDTQNYSSRESHLKEILYGEMMTDSVILEKFPQILVRDYICSVLVKLI